MKRRYLILMVGFVVAIGIMFGVLAMSADSLRR